ncbi:SCO3374 family protein [Streptomyces sp. NPDC051907]|uniref:SCO3374 family protein n=1 Tax=Streptomyces sp. NPDC051907 TaxID=3155284 RepID=UPI00341BF80F
MAFTVPLPRAPLEGGAAPWAQWYEDELGWAAAPGSPVRLLTGLRFDVLELPVDAGVAVLRRMDLPGPVALSGRRMRLLVAAGSADELPGLLDWLQWGGVALDLTAVGSGGRMTAPPPPGWSGLPEGPGEPVEPWECSATDGAGRSACRDRSGHSDSRGAAVWLRPPAPGREVEPTLPALAPFGHSSGFDGNPDLVRLVDTAATACHRVRLLRTNSPRAKSQPLAFS